MSLKSKALASAVALAAVSAVALPAAAATPQHHHRSATCSTGAIHGTIYPSESLRTFMNGAGDDAEDILIQTFICNPGVSQTMRDYYDAGNWDHPMNGLIGVWYIPAGG